MVMRFLSIFINPIAFASINFERPLLNFEPIDRLRESYAYERHHSAENEEISAGITR